MPRFKGDNLEANVKLVQKFRNFADKKGCTVAQLALAWLLKQGNDIVPIPGTKRTKYLEENWAALQVHLSDGEEAEIRNSSELTAFSGQAAPAQFLEYFYRDTAEETADQPEV